MNEAPKEVSSIELATRRLKSALAGLETALDARKRSSVSADGLRAEMQLLSSDRAKLAEALDSARERAAALEQTNRDVSRRLDEAMATIRSILDDEQARA